MSKRFAAIVEKQYFELLNFRYDIQIFKGIYSACPHKNYYLQHLLYFTQLNTRNFKQNVNTGKTKFEYDKQFAALWDIIVYKATMKGPTVLSNVS